MSFVRVTAPLPILGLDEVKKHLGVRHTDDDALIDGLIEAATGHIDGPEAWLGRCLGPQTWDWKLDAYDAGQSWAGNWCRGENFIVLPVCPVISVGSITYVDGDGASQSWTDFEAFGLGSIGPARLQPSWNAAWPSVRSQPEAVTVRFTAGYQKGNGESPEVMIEAVPLAIKAALKLLIGDLYAFRETAQIGSVSSPIQMAPTVEALLNPFRVWRA